MVLLKNEGQLLPLSKAKIKSIAVIGPDAYPAVPVGGGSARVQPFASVSFLQGFGNYLGASVPVYFDRGIPTLDEMAKNTKFSTKATNGEPGLRAEYFESNDLSGYPLIMRTEQHVNFGGSSNQVFPERTLSDRWTGYYLPEHAGLYDVFVESTGEDGGSYRLYVDGQLAFDNWSVNTALMNSVSLPLEATSHKFVLEHHGRSRWLGSRLRFGIVPHDGVVDPQAKMLAAKSDVVVVAVGFDPETESEAADRTFHLPPGQAQLIQEMRAANKNVVVVITGGGSVDMNSWVDKAPAILQAWYPGQEGGTALAEILFGDVNPSGHLPVSFERRWEDNPVHDTYYPEAGAKQVVYKEGVFVGYRGYEHNGKKPLFPFGHGLSYTTFVYSNLSVVPGVPKGGKVWSAEVSFEVTNTGKREGAEVAQVYVADKHAKLPRPAKELKGFSKVVLKPGEKRRVKLTLDERALSYYDVDSKQWRAEPGQFEVLVGSSSDSIQLQGKLTLSKPATTAAIPESSKNR
jgi:beta-glucosidase